LKWPVLGKSRSHGATVGYAEFVNSEDDEATIAFSSACLSFHSEDLVSPPLKVAPPPSQRRKKVRTAVWRLRSALANAVAGRHRQVGMGARLAGTLYGHRRGHVHLAFQVDPRACPALLLELAAPTAALVREMASGLVRIALECERADTNKKLVEETVWRAYCNGKSCGYAVRVRRRGLARAPRAGARVHGRRGHTRGRGRRHVHAGAVRARRGVPRLGGVLHDEPGQQWRTRAQRLPPQGLSLGFWDGNASISCW
jgi:hypothetical protein